MRKHHHVITVSSYRIAGGIFPCTGPELAGDNRPRDALDGWLIKLKLSWNKKQSEGLFLKIVDLRKIFFSLCLCLQGGWSITLTLKRREEEAEGVTGCLTLLLILLCCWAAAELVVICHWTLLVGSCCCCCCCCCCCSWIWVTVCCGLGRWPDWMLMLLLDIMPGLGLLSGELVREETWGIWISCLMWRVGFDGQLLVEEEGVMLLAGWLLPYTPPWGGNRPWLSCLCRNTCKGCGHWESWEKKKFVLVLIMSRECRPHPAQERPTPLSQVEGTSPQKTCKKQTPEQV